VDAHEVGHGDGIEGALAPYVDDGRVPGVVAVVARGDDVDVTVLGAQSIGGTPMRHDSLFRIASAGKPITAAAALALVADGALALDDAVADLLPELAAPRVLRRPTSPLDDTVAADRAITVRHLLTSTSGHGFPSDLAAPIAEVLGRELHQGPPRPQEVPPPDEWMARLARIPLVHQPGEGFAYNTAFDVLSVLVERASGLPFAEHVARRVLRPLGIHDTGFAVGAGDLGRMTSYYRHGDGGGLVLVDAPDGQWSAPPPFASGAGGYVSSATDLLAFSRMLLEGGGGVLPPDLVAAMTSDQLTTAIRATDSLFLDGQSWGFGVGVDIEARRPWNVAGRFGWVGGTGTSAYAVPSDGSVAILLTQVELDGPTGTEVLEAFWTAAARQLGHHR